MTNLYSLISKDRLHEATTNRRVGPLRYLHISMLATGSHHAIFCLCIMYFSNETSNIHLEYFVLSRINNYNNKAITLAFLEDPMK